MNNVLRSEDFQALGHLADEILDLALPHPPVVGEVDVQVTETTVLRHQVQLYAAGVDVPHSVQDPECQGSIVFVR